VKVEEKIVSLRVSEKVKDSLKRISDRRGMTIKGLITVFEKKLREGKLNGII